MRFTEKRHEEELPQPVGKDIRDSEENWRNFASAQSVFLTRKLTSGAFLGASGYRDVHRYVSYGITARRSGNIRLLFNGITSTHSGAPEALRRAQISDPLKGNRKYHHNGITARISPDPAE